MNKAPYRNITILLSIIGVALLYYFLFSPVLLLPAEPTFGRLTIGRPSIFIDGEPRILIYGMQLVQLLTHVGNNALFLLMLISTVLVLFLPPFIAFIRSKALLIVIGFSAIINLLALTVVITSLSPYIENTSAASGGISMFMLLTALLFRIKALESMSVRTDKTA